MRDIADHGEIVKSYSGQGQITFPMGARIQCYFELAQYSSGKELLTCTGRFAKAGYPAWERLISQYQVEPAQLTKQQRGPTERFEGQTKDGQQLNIQRMYLIASQASDVSTNNLTLEMRFDCQDTSIVPSTDKDAQDSGNS